MRYSANLNIIVKAIEKATFRMSRDFIELENLQTNPASAAKFANACYNKVKQVLLEDLTRLRGDYNIFFSDGEKVIRSNNAEYSYVIFPIDGMENLLRSNPDFTVAIALRHHDKNGGSEAISVAISKIVGGENYYCEKGFGAFANNRRIRVSKRPASDFALVASENSSLLPSGKTSLRSYGCRTMELAYVASSRLEKAIFSKENSELLNHSSF
jgi:myo-inositol-1(or 4)-monophosphatase